jgi:Photosynthetic reaction centre cytochrome C subunit
MAEAMTASSAILPLVLAMTGSVYAQNNSSDRPKGASEEIHIPAGKENLPAEQVFQNIQILKGKPASVLPGMMKALNKLLGVQCTYCHVEGAWQSEDPQPKRTARRMFQMIDSISEKYFDGREELSCWTCHRGSPKPSNGGAEISAGLATLPKERQKLLDAVNPGPDKNISSEQAFQNIQVLNNTPAGRLAPTMAAFTIALNVDCSHCHLADQYDDDDKPAKKRTREMVRMVKSINHQFFDDQAKVGCWTCHRGAVKPETAYFLKRLRDLGPFVFDSACWPDRNGGGPSSGVISASNPRQPSH